MRIVEAQKRRETQTGKLRDVKIHTQKNRQRLENRLARFLLKVGISKAKVLKKDLQYCSASLLPKVGLSKGKILKISEFWNFWKNF